MTKWEKILWDGTAGYAGGEQEARRIVMKIKEWGKGGRGRPKKEIFGCDWEWYEDSKIIQGRRLGQVEV